MVYLRKTKNCYDTIATLLNRLSRGLNFVKLKTADTSTEFVDTFFTNIFKHHGMTDSTMSDSDRNFTSASWEF